MSLPITVFDMTTCLGGVDGLARDLSFVHRLSPAQARRVDVTHIAFGFPFRD